METMSKTKFCVFAKIELALAETICHFNKGAGSDLILHKQYGSETTSNMRKSLLAIDNKRVKNATKKITQKYRLSQRIKRAKSKTKLSKPCTSCDRII